MISELLQNLNDREELTAILIQKLSSEKAMNIPHGKLWIERKDKKQSFITIVQDRVERTIGVVVRINDGSSTTFNHTASYTFNEEDDQFFNLFVLINKNCLLR